MCALAGGAVTAAGLPAGEGSDVVAGARSEGVAVAAGAGPPWFKPSGLNAGLGCASRLLLEHASCERPCMSCRRKSGVTLPYLSPVPR